MHPTRIMADIGTDHGWVPIALCKKGICSRALALDVAIGPLERATTHIAEAGLSDRIETRLSNGLEALIPGEASTILIAGMGGALMVEILEKGRKVVQETEELILSPHSEWKKVRQYLEQAGLAITEEKMLEEEGKLYLLMRILPKQPPAPPSPPLTKELAYTFGACLLLQKDPVLLQFVERRLEENEKIRAALGGKGKTISPRILEKKRELWQEKSLLLQARALLTGKEVTDSC